MPGGDRTGPAGAGPMTGRGAGFCMRYGVPGYMNPQVSFGGGRGRGFGRGQGGFGRGQGGFGFGGSGQGWRRHGGWANPDLSPGYPREYPDYPEYDSVPEAELAGNREQQLKYLKAQAKNIERSLKQINHEIAELSESDNSNS